MSEPLSDYQAAVFTVISRIDGGDDAAIMDPDTLAMTAHLVHTADPADLMPVRLMLALHLRRANRVAPADQIAELLEVVAAIRRLGELPDDFVADPAARAHLRSLDARIDSELELYASAPVVWTAWAMEILEDEARSSDLAQLDRAVALTRQAAAVGRPGSTDLVGWQSNLGHARLRRYDRTGDVADLEVAEAAFAEAVESAPPESLSLYLSNRAVALGRLAARTGDPATTNTCVDTHRQALSMAAPGGEHLGQLAFNFADALRTRFHRTGTVADLEESVSVIRGCLAGYEGPARQRDLMRFALAEALTDRYDRRTAAADLAEALGLLRDLDASGAPPIAMTRFLGVYSSALVSAYQAGGGPETLASAIARYERIVQLTPRDHPDFGGRMSNWALSLYRRYQASGDQEELDRVIDAFRAAVSALPLQSSLVTTLMNLGAALDERFRRLGAAADLDESITVSRRALGLLRVEDPGRASVTSNLAIALRNRSARGAASLHDLEEAIRLGYEAVDLTAADSPDRPSMLSNLGNSLRAAYTRTGATAYLDEAIGIAEEAVELTAPDDPVLPGWLSNLGQGLRMRFERMSRLPDLERAIEVTRRAVALKSRVSTDDSRFRVNLGGMLLLRYRETGRVEDLDEAIGTAEVAHSRGAGDVEHARFLSNLTNILAMRFRAGGDPADIAEAIRVGRLAVETAAERGELVLWLANLGSALYARFQATRDPGDAAETLEVLRRGATIDYGPPEVRAGCGMMQATLAAELRDWAECRAAIRSVLTLAPAMASAELSPADRRYHLERLAGLGAVGAWAELTDRAHLPLDERAAAAWTMLEAGRSVLLRQSLNTRGDLRDLARLDRPLADEIRRQRAALADGASSAAQRIAAAVALENAMGRAQELLSLRQTKAIPSIEDIHAAAGSGIFIAHLHTPYGVGALTMNGGTCGFVPLPELSTSDLRDRAAAFFRALGRNDSTELADCLQWCWQNLIEPVFAHLGIGRDADEEKPLARVWWVPSGIFSLLPLHAAGHRPPDAARRSVLDHAVSSYLPAILTAPRAGSQPVDQGRVLVVGMSRTDDPALPPLPSAGREADAVARLLGAGTRPLLDEAAGHERVVAELASATWAHFACHGTSSEEDPATSHLSLYDAPLTVKQLMEMDLDRPYLAYLSSCSSAEATVALNDESIHLAAAFQCAGFPQVIGTLWSISDHLAPVVADQIYRALSRGETPASAVNLAVRQMREALPAMPQVWAAHIHLGYDPVGQSISSGGSGRLGATPFDREPSPSDGTDGI